MFLALLGVGALAGTLLNFNKTRKNMKKKDAIRRFNRDVKRGRYK